MWSRIGGRADVQAMPSNVYFACSAKFGFRPAGAPDQARAGQPDGGRHRDARRQEGPRHVQPLSLYSNAAFDTLLDKASETIDPAAREDYYRQATCVAMHDRVVIPLHQQMNIWAPQRNLWVTARNDEGTYATSMSPAAN
jgi:peptide/nickel transport system substrate-binding protein